MTNKEIRKTVRYYEQALADRRITAKEFDAFIEALAQIAAAEAL